MSRRYRSLLISAVTFLGGLYFFLLYILPEKIGEFEPGKYEDQINQGVIVIGTMALGLGIINILRVHGAAVLKTSRGWRNSLALLIGLFTMLGVGAADFLQSELALGAWKPLADAQRFPERISKDQTGGAAPAPFRYEALAKFYDEAADRADERFGAEAGAALAAQSRQAAQYARQAALASSFEAGSTAAAGLEETLAKLREHGAAATEAARKLADNGYQQSLPKRLQSLLENGLFFPLGAAMFALLAFYIATAAYRSFRIKSWEALVMMATAVVVMLGQIPHGPLYIWEDLPQLRLWLLQNVSTPAFRAVYFGAAIAGLAMSVRIWLSLEKSPIAAENE